MLAIARTLVSQPKMLLLDEPFGGLDPPTRMSLMDDLREILDRSRISTVFVTHDRSEAQAMGDRLAVIMGGRLRQIGRPEEVFATPASEEIAAFVGVETVLTGLVAGQVGGVATVSIGDVAVSVVRPMCLERLEEGLLPQKWMGQKIYPIKQRAGCDIDYAWQVPVVEFWLRENGFTENSTPYDR